MEQRGASIGAVASLSGPVSFQQSVQIESLDSHSFVYWNQLIPNGLQLVACVQMDSLESNRFVEWNQTIPNGLQLVEFQNPLPCKTNCVTKPAALQNQLCCKTSCVANMMYDIV